MKFDKHFRVEILITIALPLYFFHFNKRYSLATHHFMHMSGVVEQFNISSMQQLVDNVIMWYVDPYRQMSVWLYGSTSIMIIHRVIILPLHFTFEADCSNDVCKNWDYVMKFLSWKLLQWQRMHSRRFGFNTGLWEKIPFEQDVQHTCNGI